MDDFNFDKIGWWNSNQLKTFVENIVTDRVASQVGSFKAAVEYTVERYLKEKTGKLPRIKCKMRINDSGTVRIHDPCDQLMELFNGDFATYDSTALKNNKYVLKLNLASFATGKYKHLKLIFCPYCGVEI